MGVQGLGSSNLPPQAACKLVDLPVFVGAEDMEMCVLYFHGLPVDVGELEASSAQHKGPTSSPLVAEEWRTVSSTYHRNIAVVLVHVWVVVDLFFPPSRASYVGVWHRGVRATLAHKRHQLFLCIQGLHVGLHWEKINNFCASPCARLRVRYMATCPTHRALCAVACRYGFGR